MFATFQRGLLSLAIVTALLSSQNVELAAQATTPAAGTAPVPSNVVKQSRPYYVEGTVVVLLMAAAVYAVCRSSRRV